MARAAAFFVSLLVAGAIASALLAATPAAAGDIDNPDMTDKASDSVSGKPARDLLAGWVTNETESTVEFNLQTSALEPYTPYTDWQSLPVAYYAFYFDVTTPASTFSFAAQAMVPLHGPEAATVQYELHTVTYTSSGNVQNESFANTVNGVYLFRSNIIAFTVDKAFIGEPGRGDVIENIWARTSSSSQRGSGDITTEDVMMSHLMPGERFALTGGVTFYKVSLSANVTSANTTPEAPISFEVGIRSDSEAQANVSLRASSLLPANWTMRTDRPLYYVSPGTTETAIVTITPGANATNGTRRVTITGDFQDDQAGNRTTENTLTFSITVQGGAPPPEQVPTTRVPTGVPVWMLQAGGVGALAAAAFLGIFVRPRIQAAKARERFNRVSQSSWARLPRRGPGSSPVGPIKRTKIAIPKVRAGGPRLPGR